MALALKPRLLLLDEPTAGMGDQETYDITQLIRRLHKDQKLTIVLIEHDMRVVFHLADRIMVLAEGAVLAEGTPEEIAANEAVQAAYLGNGGMSGLALEAEGLHTYYGKSHILHGVGLEVREGEIVTLLGPQRRRQDDDAAQPHGADARARGRGAHLRPRHHRLAALSHRRAGRRLRAGRPAHLRQSDRRGKPAGAARAAGPVDHRAHLRAVPAPRGAQDQQGPPAFRRRAGNAGDRPRAAAQSEAAAARRAVARDWRR